MASRRPVAGEAAPKRRPAGPPTSGWGRSGTQRLARTGGRAAPRRDLAGLGAIAHGLEHGRDRLGGVQPGRGPSVGAEQAQWLRQEGAARPAGRRRAIVPVTPVKRAADDGHYPLTARRVTSASRGRPPSTRPGGANAGPRPASARRRPRRLGRRSCAEATSRRSSVSSPIRGRPAGYRPSLAR